MRPVSLRYRFAPGSARTPGPGAPSGTSPSARRVRRLQVALGVIWLLDGALQFQPFMFTRSFVNDVLIPSAQGNVGFISRPTVSIAHFIAPNIVAWNALFATVQVALGVGIVAGALTRRTSLLRFALAGSIAWSVLVWWLSEGLGGVLTEASPLSGAPGAVVLYLVAAVLLWPGLDSPAPLLGGRFAKGVWLGLWSVSAFLLLEPANQGRGAVSSIVSNASSGEPGVIHSFLGSVASSLEHTGPWLDTLLAVMMLAIGLGVAFRWFPRVLLALSIGLAAAIWVFGEGFGGVLTGQGTDPNSGPLWVLLALCMWTGLRVAAPRVLLASHDHAQVEQGMVISSTA